MALRLAQIDCHYLEPGFAAAYLLHDGREAAFIDTGTARANPHFLAALADEGLAPEQVRYVIPTHAHLDHAGGAAALMELCPRATLLAHPRAARHLIDPSRLEASARRVYGDAEFEKLYGPRLQAIAAERVRTPADEESVELAGRPLRFLHTAGHAKHHFCVLDGDGGRVFTGDSFGLRYPFLARWGFFIFPSTSPTDFDAAEARASVRRIAACGAREARLTHFGAVDRLDEARDQLLAWLDVHEGILQEARARGPEGEGLAPWIEERLAASFRAELERRGGAPSAEEWAWLELDVRLNAAGLAHVAQDARAR